MGISTALMAAAATTGGILAAKAMKKPKTPKPPAVPPPPPIPEVEEEAIRRFGRKRKGRAATVITGALEPEYTGKKLLLGG